MRHPAENFIKYLLIKDAARVAQATQSFQQETGMHIIPPNTARPLSSEDIIKKLDEWGFLQPEVPYLDSLRAASGALPAGFEPADRTNRGSMRYLREQGVYEMFFPTPAIDEAWKILADQRVRQIVEQMLMAKCATKPIILMVNRKYALQLTEEGLASYNHFFWNVNLLSFDQWGRYLYNRSILYEDYMALLKAPPELLLFKLRIEQQTESKAMIKRAQEIARATLEQVSLLPGAGPEKVKSIGTLVRSLVECDGALSASDVTLGGVLKQFEQFRVSHNLPPAADIKQLAPNSQASHCGVACPPIKDKVH